MKIGYINIRSPNPARGPSGRTVHIQEVCRAWQKMGHEVFIITGSPLSIAVDVKIYNLSVPTPLSFDRFRRKIATILSTAYNKIKGRQTVSINSEKERKLSTNISQNNFKKLSWSPRVLYRDVVQIINEYQYDTFVYKKSKEIMETEKPDFLYQRLIFGELAGIKLAKEYELPIVMEINSSNTFRDEWPCGHTLFFEIVKRMLEKKLCQNADAVVVVTSYIRNYFIKQDIQPNKLFVNFNGVDLERYYPDDKLRQIIRKQYDLSKKLIVGFLGNFVSWHDLDTLIHSAKIVLGKVPKVHFFLVGDGPLRLQIEKMINVNGMDGCVTFTGSIANEEVPGYINAMDIAVSPLQKDHIHGLPIKLFEYLAVSKPVIISKFPDIETVITDHKNGILVEPEDKMQLADAILELISDKGLRKKIGIEGRCLVEKNYSWERNAMKILDIYKNIQHKDLCLNLQH